LILWYQHQNPPFNEIVSSLMITTEAESDPLHKTDFQFIGQMLSQAAHNYSEFSAVIGTVTSPRSLSYVILLLACFSLRRTFGVSLSGWNVRLCKADVTPKYFEDLAVGKQPSEQFKVSVAFR
jgi:hypothetical protein